jgi:4-hydroxybenzoate polyprenyltransferase
MMQIGKNSFQIIENSGRRALDSFPVQALQNAFNLMTSSSLLIACTGFSQTYGGYVLLGAKPNIYICLSVFLMTLSIYSLNKLTDIKEDSINRPDRIQFLKGREKQIFIISAIAMLLSVILACSIEIYTLLPLMIPFIANCIYSLQISPKVPRLKDIPFVKNIVVGLSWALVCTLMPAITLDYFSPSMVIVVAYFMLIKDFINSTLCDLKDVKGDMQSGVRTIPVVLGPKKTKRVLLAMSSMLLPLLFLVKSKTLIMMALLIFNEYLLIFSFNESSHPTILEFFVDGEWLLICMLLIALKVI